MTPAGLIEALERVAAVPGAIPGLFVIGVVLVGAFLLVRGALGR